MSQTDKPTLSLDLRGEHCPYNAIATLETLATMQPGERLEVVTDCSQSVHGFPKIPSARATNAWRWSSMARCSASS